MIKSSINILILIAAFIFFAGSASGQRSEKDLLSHKIIVNQDDCTIVAYVKPVRGWPVETDKRYYWFSAHRIKSTQGGYSGQLLNGDYRESYANKNLKELGYFYKGLKTGTWSSWNPNGKLTADYTWNFGEKNGTYHKYDSLGGVMESGKYRNGLLHGKQKIMVGDSTRTVYYHKGKVTAPKSIVPGFIRRIFN